MSDDGIDPLDEWIGHGLEEFGGADPVYDGELDADLIDVDPLTVAVADHPARERFNFGDPHALETGEDKPTLLKRTDGQALLYRGSVNLFAGEPGSCKSWVAQYETARMANAGEHVLYVDYESTYRSVMRRLGTVGLRSDSRDRIHYPTRLGMLTDEDVRKLAEYARELDVDLIVIDGVAEALAAHGLTEDRAGEYAKWHEHVARKLARGSSAAVLLLDHVPKPAQGRAARGSGAEPDLYPRGSGHKLAAIDGAAYMLSMVEPLSRQNEGTVDLTIAKDREGYVGPKRWRAARVTLTPANDGAELYVEVSPPKHAGRPPVTDEARVASIEAKLTDELVRDVLDAATRAARATKAPVTRSTVIDYLREGGVKFADKLVTPALIRLTDRGDLESSTGKRNATLYGPPPKQQRLEP